MTSHQDVAGVVAQLRAISGYPIFRDFEDGTVATTSIRTAADLLESQAKDLSEAEALAFQLNSGAELQSLMRLNNELLSRVAEAARLLVLYGHPEVARSFLNAAKEKT